MVQKLRNEDGSKRFLMASLYPSDGKVEGQGWLSWSEKQAQKLCRLTRTWGRPKGIDAHLEALNE
jgi:hypothetical protein